MKKLTLLLLTSLLFVTMITTTFAATKTWVPTNGGSWTTNGNWNPNGRPAAGDSVVIPADQSGDITNIPTISLSALVINGSCNLVVQSGSTITVTSTYTVAAGKTVSLLAQAGTTVNFVLAATSTATINGVFTLGTGTSTRSCTVYGNLIMGASAIVNGYGPFTLAAGATITTANATGIDGSIQVTGGETFSSSANYAFNGTVPQVTGSSMPATVNNLTINNTSGSPIAVDLSKATTVNGVLSLTNGILDNLSPETVTLNGTLNQGAGSLTGPLPVELTSFTAVLNGTSALLKWSTATETNNSGFQIERSVEGSNAWVKVTFVNGAGTSNAPKYYSYEDKNLAPGVYVYRIKQIDNDGTTTIYNANDLPKVDAGKSNGLQLCGNYPNPFNPSTEIRFSVPQSGYASLKVYNVIGQEVSTLFSGNATAGHYITATFNASRLASGIYFARLQYNGQSLVQRMLLTK
jgi:hypothetical protein